MPKRYLVNPKRRLKQGPLTRWRVTADIIVAAVDAFDAETYLLRLADRKANRARLKGIQCKETRAVRLAGRPVAA
jgi:hypothetical protein